MFFLENVAHILILGVTAFGFYRFGYRRGAKDVLNEWKEFNIQMFGEEESR